MHAPEREVAFVEAGDGLNRRPVMYNDFVMACFVIHIILKLFSNEGGKLYPFPYLFVPLLI